jgi:penicillin-insensitive murein endopeptidase
MARMLAPILLTLSLSVGGMVSAKTPTSAPKTKAKTKAKTKPTTVRQKLKGQSKVGGAVIPVAKKIPPTVAKRPVTKPPTRRDVRRALRFPRGSTSVGSTSWGELNRASRFPLRGSSYRFFPHIKERETHFGTDELGRLVRRVARRVARKVKRTELRLGNAGYRSGKKIPWSVSHQSGRDIDIAIFATDRRGRSKKLTDFVSFNAKGMAAKGTLKFDLKRNLSLVRALVEDTKTPVQWIFIYRPLKAMLLEHARNTKVPEDTIQRLESVLRQPSDSSPHKDHFHVRIFCSVQDRLHGCLDRPPFHAWVDRGEEKYTERVNLLLRISHHKKAGTRRAALDKLRAMRATSATGRFVESLRDPARMVRQAAWGALRALGTQENVPGILSVLKDTPDPKRASAIFSLLNHVGSNDVREIALTMLSTPTDYLHPDAIKRGLKQFMLSAVAILKKGQKQEAMALVPLLSSKDAETRQAAHQALRLMTNQKIRGKLSTRNKKRRGRIVTAWKTFFKSQKDETWLQWQRMGFEARGFVFDGKMMQPKSVPTLIKAIGHREDEVSINAIRVLGELTDHRISPTARTKRNSIRHWKSWWRDHKDRFAKGS